MKKPVDVSDAYWDGLSEENRLLYGRVRPMPKATYVVDQSITYTQAFLEEVRNDMEGKGGSLELIPDFQRGHVWTEQQQVRYIESLIRGNAPKSILFNCPSWSGVDRGGDVPKHSFQCIDGLQRLTAVQRFMANEIGVFDGMLATDLKDGIFALKQVRLSLSIFEFSTRADLLQFYLDLNAGGTVHADEELARVGKLLQDARTLAGGQPEQPLEFHFDRKAFRKSLKP